MHAGVRAGLAGAPDGRGRHRPRACRSCRTWSTLHGGTFELRSELRKGTEAMVCLPSKPRAAHHAAAAAAGPGARTAGRRRAPRFGAQLRAGHDGTNGPQWRGIHSRLAEVHCHAPGCFLHSGAARGGRSPHPGGDEEANASPPASTCARSTPAPRLCAGCGRSLEEIAALGGDDGRRAASVSCASCPRGELGHGWRRRGDEWEPGLP